MNYHALIGENSLQTAGKMTATALEAEPWRCVTALTLHADPEHLAANGLCLGVFGLLCARRIGLGVTLAVAVAGGAVGNALDAYVRAAYLPAADYASVGASTAVFALAGACSAAYRSFLMLICAVALVIGSHAADVNTGSHAAGLFAGLLLGIVLRRRSDEPAPFTTQLGAAGLSVAAVATCWSMALGG